MRKGRFTCIIGALVILALAVTVLGCGGGGGEKDAPKKAAVYPDKPITVICPYAAGGAVDVTSRIWAKHAEKLLGQPVVVDDRTGGGGVIGHTAGATAAPDGYTLTMITSGVLWQHLTGSNVAFTPDSFIPVAQVTFDPNVLIAKKGGKSDMPAKEFIEYVKQNPGALSMGTGGRWATHDMARGILQTDAGLKFNPVFFDGGSQVVTNLIAGNLDVGFPFQSEFGSQVAAGTLVVIASASQGRHPFLPESPTLQEVGVNVVAGTWRGIAVPKGTPDDIVKKLADVTEKIMKDPAAQAEFKQAFIDPNYKNTADFQKIYNEDAVKYKEIVAKLK